MAAVLNVDAAIPQSAKLRNSTCIFTSPNCMWLISDPARGTILRIPVEPTAATAVCIFKTDARSLIDTDRRQSLATGIHALRALDRPGSLAYKVTGFSSLKVRSVSEAILTCWPLVAA